MVFVNSQKLYLHSKEWLYQTFSKMIADKKTIKGYK